MGSPCGRWDYRSQKIFAYDMDTKRRVPIEEFDTLIAAGNRSPNGIWSDGATLWVGKLGSRKDFRLRPEEQGTDPISGFRYIAGGGQ